ncbi:MAG: glycyl-radical enzyme activating protein [Lentisphaeria bacterium]|nr:glycyl-radical enzyme activating protein [Lentisphaeria bacterium]
MLQARYVDVKRFAVHDGPGIRTTLFLKGCPLRCIWCHNPESRKSTPELAFYRNKCCFCGECARKCACHRVGNGGHEIDRAACRACGACVPVCPAEALELFGKSVSAAEAASWLLEDEMFYSGGGGVTLSGGEPLLQSAFCAELLRTLKERNIHCAVDTCGSVPWGNIEEVLPYTDLFLYDIKCIDPVRHRELTGAGNELILENLKKLSSRGKAVEIRMPLVPGHNTAEEYIRGAGAFLAGLANVSAVRLLPYHSFARSKFRAVGHADTMPDVEPPTPEELERAAAILRSHNLQTIVS